MRSSRLGVIAGLLAIAACSPEPTRLAYTDPVGGALRLVKNPSSSANVAVLDFVVGDAPLTGFSTGFNLPIDTARVSFGTFEPGRALDPGSAPAAAGGGMGAGSLRGMVVAAQSQKAAGTGAIADDTVLPPGAILFTIVLDATIPLQAGTVFDGTLPGYALPSGGLRNKAGAVVVDASRVKIGKLEVQ
jgi:hypothetical protein